MEEGEAPLLFLCPISMELMENPVTVSTGITYERKNIEKWFFTYRKSLCPATMQSVETFDLTPNNTLKSLISSWQSQNTPETTPISDSEHEKLVSLLSTIELTPFKVTSLKKLRSLIETSHAMQEFFVKSGGIQVLSNIMSQIIAEGADFSAFRACEESLSVLHLLPFSDKPSVELLSKPECMNPMLLILQRGSTEARSHVLSTLQKLSATSKEYWTTTDEETIVDVIKFLLELSSDEISTKLSSSALDVLIEIVSASKKNRYKAIEAGAVCVLIELLPDSNRYKCERLLLSLKKLCECPEGRSALGDHCLGIAVVSSKILRVSDLATKLGVKILWSVCNFAPKERVIDDMMVFGAVRKLIGLLHVEWRSSTKENAVRMLTLHGGVWRQYACFPSELKEYLRLLRHQKYIN